MTPAARGSRRKATGPWEVSNTKRTSTSKVKVSLANGGINVAWLCGGDRAFTPAQLREAIDHVNHLTAQLAPIWLDFQDSNGQSYWVQLEDNKLTANDHYGENGFVRWDQLQKALEEALEATKA